MATTEHAIDRLSQAGEAVKTERRLGLQRTLRRVAVLGAGTMGARVAAHFANAGIPSLLLSRVNTKEANRSATAQKAIQTAFKGRPGAFFADETVSLVKPGNYDDNLQEIAGCDMVIETVAENLEIKRELWAKVAAVCKPGTIVATCTSGIPLSDIVAGFPEEFRKNFLGMHFFNPTRYMHLLEVIPGAETDPEVVSFVREFGERRLGKGVVLCKDTPNFIANRIGCFFGATVSKYTLELDYTIEEADALTGPLIGLPSSASFRMLDLVGIDVWADIGPNLYNNIPNDPWRDRFLLPDFELKMIERGWLGDKTKGGFYKKVTKGEEKEFWYIDWKTCEYVPTTKPKFPSVEAANAVEDIPARVGMLLEAEDRAGKFLWTVFADYFLYAAEKIGEIADSIVDIDASMRWGYAHKFGPFQMWNALGFQKIAKRLEADGRKLPDHVAKAVAAGVTELYRYTEDGRQQCFDFLNQKFAYVEVSPGVTVIADVKRANGTVKKNAGASLVDMGDGVLCVEFHSKMNSIGEDNIAMMYAGLEELEKPQYNAMIIANEGENFSVGANLMGVLMAAQDGEWDDLERAVNRFQQVNQAIKFAPKPVVTAPFQRTLGGGCEIAMHGSPLPQAELYMGQVELGVGLIPGAGGCKELLVRLKEARKVFELIAFAKVSMSAVEAKNLGFIDQGAPISMNADRLVAEAKAYALALAPGYVPRVQRTDIKVGGDAVYALLKLGVWTARQGNYISDHDVLVGEKLAYVLAGGRLSGEQLVSEQYLLDLEREAFLFLCGTQKTQERMAYMLKTGKPLRN